MVCKFKRAKFPIVFSWLTLEMMNLDDYTCCSHSGSEDDPDQNNFQKNFTKT